MINSVEKITQEAYSAYISKMQSAEPMPYGIPETMAPMTGFIQVSISNEARRLSNELQRIGDKDKEADDKTVNKTQPVPSSVYDFSNIIKKNRKSPKEEAEAAYSMKKEEDKIKKLSKEDIDNHIEGYKKTIAVEESHTIDIMVE